MRNQDGYSICPTVVREVRAEGRFVTIKTDLGTFGVLKSWLSEVPTVGKPVTLYIAGYADVVGVSTESGDVFYVKPEDRDNYDKALIGKE